MAGGGLSASFVAQAFGFVVRFAAAALLAVGGLAVLPGISGYDRPASASVPVAAGSSRSMISAGAVSQSANGTVRIIAGGCQGNHAGSGFAISPTQIITNAHVVAGSGLITVNTISGQVARGTVVLFDPQRDVAVVTVRGLHLAPLSLAPVASPGDTAMAVGFPHSGPERISTGFVQRIGQIRVADIYGHGATEQEVVIARTAVERGNSGGPLVDGSGRVLGLVFASPSGNPDLAYALTTRDIEADLQAASTRTEAVSTGGCE